MARAEDAIPYIDTDGVQRYRAGPRRGAQPSRRPKALSDEQINGLEPIHEHDLQRAMGGVAPEHLGSEGTTAGRGAMTIGNIYKDKRHGYKMRHGPGKPKNLDVMIRRAKALELRRAGFTWEDISNRKSLGYTNQRHVQRDVYRLLQQMIDTPAQEVLAIELSRLDAITQVLWQQVRAGDLNAINTMYRAMQMRQDLLGLHKINVKHEVVTVNDMDREIERLTAELKQFDDQESGPAQPISDRAELMEAQKAAGLVKELLEANGDGATTYRSITAPQTDNGHSPNVGGRKPGTNGNGTGRL